jgi:thiol:disulfide interchange protein
MISMRTIAALFLSLTALTLFTQAADFPKGSPPFVSSYRQALSKAEKEGKPVVLVFSAAWCPPCQQMKKTVYPSAEVAALHDKFVWAYLDVDESGNAKTAEKYQVNGIPHIEFLSASGKSLGRQVGGVSSDRFADMLKGIAGKASAK